MSAIFNFVIAVALALLCLPPALHAADKSGEKAPTQTEPVLVTAELLADVTTFSPGQTATLGLRLKIAPEWHIYWQNSGETGSATVVTPTGPAGYTFSPVQWPLPKRLNADVGLSYVYEREVMLLIPVTAPKDARPNEEALITVHVAWQACHDTCVDGSAKVSITLPVSHQCKLANKVLFADWNQKLPVTPDKVPSLVMSSQPFAGGKPLASLGFTWNQSVKNVEWLPVATRAVAIEEIAVKHDKTSTRVTFKPTIYKTDDPSAGKLKSLLMFDDVDGKRVGVIVPFAVSLEKAP